MDVKLDLKPEQINQFIADKILESVIGTNIKKEVEKKISELDEGIYETPLKNMVHGEVNNVVRELITTHFKDEIVEIMKKRFLNDLDKFVETALNDIKYGGKY